MIDLEGGISVDGSPPPSARVGGISRRRTIVGVGGPYGAVDLKLSPPAAHAILGMDLAALEGRCVALGDALGAPGERLVERLRDAPDWDGRFDVLEGWLLRRLADGPRAPSTFSIEIVSRWSWSVSFGHAMKVSTSGPRGGRRSVAGPILPRRTAHPGVASGRTVDPRR